MKERLRVLRQAMRENKVSAFLVPHTDEHQSEYTPGYAERLNWISGFDGSAGFACVTLSHAAIFVDGRYTLQVKDQIDNQCFERLNIPNDKPENWLLEHLKKGDIVGYDPWLHTQKWLKATEEKLSKNDIGFKALPSNLIDDVWKDQPEPSKAPAVIHRDRYSGEKSTAKRKRIAKELKASGADALVLTSLDSIAWLFNIRGNDVDRTPLVLSFAVLFANAKAILFIEPDKLTTNVINHLGKQVTCKPKSEFVTELQDMADAGMSVMVDPDRAHAAVFEALSSGEGNIIEKSDPCQLDKACKNDTELDGARNAHIRDAVAVCRFLCWVDENAVGGNYDELDAVKKFYELRKDVALFQDNSFDTISGAGPNGAIVHYRVTEKTSRKLEKDMIYLCDSGGQYLDGTTDITRTVIIGDPTEEQKDHFTRVLKGHIALAQARFPEGRTGAHLDTLARKSLWDVGLDYDHGTGHGVGSYLGVHEGPQNISPLGYKTPLKPGMILSNEPGYYKTGEYGIRIENLVIVSKSEYEEEERPMLTFETITLAPIDTRLINAHMMSAAEITWLNIYHAKVREKISPLLKGREREWLIQATESITSL